MPSIGSVTIEARLDFSSLQRDYSRLQTDAGKHGAKVGKAFGEGMTKAVKAEGINMSRVMDGVFQGIGMGFANMAAQGIASLGGLGKKVLDVGASAEKARVQFTTFTGSAVAAEKALKSVTAFAANTPFELPEVREAASKLLAFGVAANDLTKSLKTVGDVAAATGTPFNELADIYGKLRVQGRAYMEDINQLQGRGIPIIQMLAKQYGVTAETVKKLVEEGRIGFAQIDYALERSTQKGGQFANMMDNLSKTTEGKLSNMADKVTAAFESIFTTLQPVINASIDLVSEFLGSMNVDLKSAGAMAQDLAKWIADNRDEAIALGKAISGTVNGALGATRDLVKSVQDYLNKYPAVLEGIQFTVDLIGKGYNVWGNTIKDVTGDIGIMLNRLGEVAQKVKEIGESFVQWGTASLNSWGVNTGGGNSSSMIFPVEGGGARLNMTGGGGMFGAHRHYGAHSGQDYAYGTGTAVRAAFSGKIKQKVSNRGEWKLVLEGEVNGKHTEMDLVHLDTAVVNQGQSVTQGQLLGTVGGAKGSWGSTGAHLHMGVRQNGKIIDPRTINFSNAALITNPISGAAVAAGMPVTQAITASTAASSSGKPPALLPISAEEAKRQRDKEQREIDKKRRAAEKAAREAQRIIEENDRKSAQAISNSRGLRDQSFDIATQQGRAGLSGAALDIWNTQRSGMSALQGLRDKREDLVTARGIKVRDGVTGGIDYTATIKDIDGLIAAQQKLNKTNEEAIKTTNAREEAEKKAEEDRKKRFDGDEKRRVALGYGRDSRNTNIGISNRTRLLGLSGGAQELETLRQSQSSEMQGMMDTHRDLQDQLAINQREGINDGGALRKRIDDLEVLIANTEELHRAEMRLAESRVKQESLEDRMEQEKKRIESQNRLMETLRKRRMDSLDTELSAINAVGSSLSNAFKAAITGTESLGQVVVNLLGDISSRLLDIGLSSIFGSAGSGKGILSGVFNSIFNKGSKNKLDVPISSYAVGTPYVPTNQLAYLHQGEAVIPAKYNNTANNISPINITIHNAPGEGAMDNNQANKLTEQVRRVVESELLRQRRPGGMMY